MVSQNLIAQNGLNFIEQIRKFVQFLQLDLPKRCRLRNKKMDNCFFDEKPEKGGIMSGYFILSPDNFKYYLLIAQYGKRVLTKLLKCVDDETFEILIFGIQWIH